MYTFFLQDIYKYYVLDVPACTWARRYSSTQYTLPDSEQLAEVDNFVVLKKVIFFLYRIVYYYLIENGHMSCIYPCNISF